MTGMLCFVQFVLWELDNGRERKGREFLGRV